MCNQIEGKHNVNYGKLFALTLIAVTALGLAPAAYGNDVTLNNFPSTITLMEGQSERLNLSLTNDTTEKVFGLLTSIAVVTSGDKTDYLTSTITNNQCAFSLESLAGLGRSDTCTFSLLLLTPSDVGDTDNDFGSGTLAVVVAGTNSNGQPFRSTNDSHFTVQDAPHGAAEPSPRLLVLLVIAAGVWFERKRLIKAVISAR
jgi:hypothetical protein